MSASLTPWINFQLSYTKDASSDPVKIIQQSPNTLIIDSINLTNTTEYNSFIDVNVLRPYLLIHLDPDTHLETSREILYDSPFFTRNLSLRPFGKEQLLKDDCLYLQPGDYLTAQSDYFKNQFDCLSSYREVISPSSPVVQVQSLVPSKNSVTGIITVTGTTTENVNLVVGSPILITGASPQAYNGVYIATTTGANTFVYALDAITSSLIDVSTSITGDIKLLPLSLRTVEETIS